MDYPVTAGRSSVYPEQHYGAHYKGDGVVTFCEAGDLINPGVTVQAIPTVPVVSLTQSPVVVGPEFFGMHIQKRVNDTGVALTYKTVRSHDMANGKSRWKFIETADNVWDFTDIDAWVDAHYAAGRDLVFTLFGTPTFYSARDTEIGAYGPGNPGIQAEPDPTKMDRWDRFCTKMATRYLGKIKYWEIWNEPNAYNNGVSATPGTNFFFSGTFAKLAEMTRRANIAIKAVDPTSKIISPSVTSWSPTAAQSAETYFTGMMAADSGNGPMKNWVDIVAVHLYLPPSNRTQDLPGIINRINAAKVTAGVSGLPTWDTESAPVSIASLQYLSDDSAMRVIGRCLIIMALKGIARTMYYQYDSSTMGFSARPDITAYWERLVTLLMSGRILAVSLISDGRIAYSTSSGMEII